MRLAALVAALAVVAGACTADDPALDRTPPTVASSTTGAGSSTTSTTSTTAGPAPPTELAATCPDLPPRARPPEDRPAYVMNLVVDLAADEVRGELTVRFVPDLAVDRLVFRLWPNGPRPAGAGASLSVSDVRVGAHPVRPDSPDPTTLSVPLGGEVAAGSAVTASLRFALDLPGPVNDRVSRTGEAVRLGSFFPILAWEPGVGWALDPPTSGFAEASVAPVADFTYSVDAGDLDVLASGVPDGSGRWRAEAMRDVAVSVGRFSTAEGTAQAGRPVTVRVGVHEGLGVDPAAFRDKVISVLERFAARYGAYPWPEYSLAITPDLSGGIEYPGHVMQGPTTYGRTTSHEVAHMWFYGLVGNHQGRDPWLDEGIATWAEARYEGTLGSMRSRAVPAAGRDRLGEPMTYWESRQSAYYRSVYVQGAQALAALGDADLVDCALAHHVARNAHRVASPADLVAAFEPVFPDAAATLAGFGAPS